MAPDLLTMLKETGERTKFVVTSVGTIRTELRGELCGDCPMLAMAKFVDPLMFMNYHNLDFSPNIGSWVLRFNGLVRHVVAIDNIFCSGWYWVVEAADNPRHFRRKELEKLLGFKVEEIPVPMMV